MIAFQVMQRDPTWQHVTDPHINVESDTETSHYCYWPVSTGLTGGLAMALTHGNYDFRASLATVYFE